jgi:hypothetical protein
VREGHSSTPAWTVDDCPNWVFGSDGVSDSGTAHALSWSCLFIFLLVAVGVSTVVDLAARRTVEAARARAEAETLSTVAGSVLRGGRPLTALLDQVRETFGLTSVTLLEHRPDAPSTPDSQHHTSAWRVAASIGPVPDPW